MGTRQLRRPDRFANAWVLDQAAPCKPQLKKRPRNLFYAIRRRLQSGPARYAGTSPAGTSPAGTSPAGTSPAGTSPARRAIPGRVRHAIPGRVRQEGRVRQDGSGRTGPAGRVRQDGSGRSGTQDRSATSLQDKSAGQVRLRLGFAFCPSRALPQKANGGLLRARRSWS